MILTCDVMQPFSFYLDVKCYVVLCVDVYDKLNSIYGNLVGREKPV